MGAFACSFFFANVFIALIGEYYNTFPRHLGAGEECFRFELELELELEGGVGVGGWSWSWRVELEIGTTDQRGQGFAYARPFGEWILENAMRFPIRIPNFQQRKYCTGTAISKCIRLFDIIVIAVPYQVLKAAIETIGKTISFRKNFKAPMDATIRLAAIPTP